MTWGSERAREHLHVAAAIARHLPLPASTGVPEAAQLTLVALDSPGQRPNGLWSPVHVRDLEVSSGWAGFGDAVLVGPMAFTPEAALDMTLEMVTHIPYFYELDDVLVPHHDRLLSRIAGAHYRYHQARDRHGGPVDMWSALATLEEHREREAEIALDAMKEERMLEDAQMSYEPSASAGSDEPPF